MQKVVFFEALFDHLRIVRHPSRKHTGFLAESDFNLLFDPQDFMEVRDLFLSWVDDESLEGPINRAIVLIGDHHAMFTRLHENGNHEQGLILTMNRFHGKISVHKLWVLILQTLQQCVHGLFPELIFL